MKIQLKSKLTKDLSKKEILEICKLKNKHWVHGLNTQKKWFYTNIKKEDIHNMLLLNKKIIGYTVLRKGTLKFFNKKKIKLENKYLLFETLIIEKKFGGKGFGNKLMKFNSYIIKKNKKMSFLICKKKIITFYKNFKWKLLPKDKFVTKYKKFRNFGMIFNPIKRFSNRSSNFFIEFYV